MATINPSSPSNIELPLGLMADTPWLKGVTEKTKLNLIVPANYEALIQNTFNESEVLGIQRLLTLAKIGVEIKVFWDENMLRVVRRSASIFPMLAVLLQLNKVTHLTSTGANALLDITASLRALRKNILRHRLQRDFFADSDILLCADDSGEPLPDDLYDQSTQQLRNRDDFETLVVDALAAQLGDSVSRADIYKRANALGVIVAELFENTDMHGKYDFTGRPISSANLRGLIFKRIKAELLVLKRKPSEPKTRSVDCFEVSVFDSGVGYFSSYMREALSEKIKLAEEWQVLHNCLGRHYHPELIDHRAGHRALGLYEVLRALQTLKGRIEIRTGRLFAYRTFFDGEIQAQMETRAEFSHFAWPKPKLLDVEKKYLAQPSEHEVLIGSSIRIIIPLW